MEIRGNKPPQGSETRRFTAGRAAPQAGTKSFAASLKRASDAMPAPAPASQPQDPATAPSDGAPTDPASGPAVSGQAASAAAPAAPADAAATPAQGGQPAQAETSFADHMEMVRFRLKTGYYASKAIEDALSEKLSGYFDELA